MHRYSRIRLAAIGSMLAALLALFTAAPASATSYSNSDPNNYLALGDSVPFGYNPLLVQPGVDPDTFVGYPQLAADLTRPRLKVYDAACPGETSTSLITGTRPDNGCQNYRQFIAALHVPYTGSQLAFATQYVADNPRTKVVSVMVGANDLFRLQSSCAGAPNPKACVVAGLPALLGTLAANLTTIYSSLRAAGFHGELVAVTYYSTNYADPFVTGAVTQLNTVLAAVTHAFGGEVADGFGAFAAAAGPSGSTCDAGLLIHLTATTCDVHPSPAGAALLASALAATLPS